MLKALWEHTRCVLEVKRGVLIIHKDKGGQTTVEYVLVLVLIVLGIILAFADADVKKAIGIAAQDVQSGVLNE